MLEVIRILSYLKLRMGPIIQYTRLERLVRDKHSSLLGPFVSYEDNEVRKWPLFNYVHYICKLKVFKLTIPIPADLGPMS